MPTLDLDGARIALMEHGAGAPVVALHCSASAKEQWRALAELIGGEFRLLAPDLYGYGESDGWPGRQPMALTDEAAIVTAVMRRCDGPIDLIGHSYGGAVALRAALEQRLNSLTLIEPVAFTLLRDGADRAHLADVRELAELVSHGVVSGDFHGGMKGFIDHWNGDGSWAALEPTVQTDLARRLPKVALDFSALLSDETRLDAYCALDMPTLIVRGAQTPAAPMAVTRLLAETIPGARLEIIEGAGHMSPVTHVDAVNAAIAEHLRRVRPPRGRNR